MNGVLDNSISPSRRSASRRFLAALALSCLFHALAILGPILGKRQPPDRLHSGWLASRTVKLTAAFLPADGAEAKVPVGRPPNSDVGKPAVPEPAAEGAGILSLPGVPYFPAESLTRRPQPMFAVDLDTPEIHNIPASGRLVLTLWIDAAGRVTNVEIESSELPAVFATAAAAAFGRSRFIPGEIDGKPVGSIVKLEVAYDDPRLPLNPPATHLQTPVAAGS